MSDEQPIPAEEEATIAGTEPAPAAPSAGATEEYPTLAGAYPTATVEPDGITPYADSDPDADLDWVPRRTGGIRLAIPIAALIAVLLVAGGFWGGAALEKSHGGGSGSGLASLASRFRTARGGTSTTGGTGATGATGFAGFGGTGASTSAASGTISVVDGDTLYVLTSTGSLVKVTLTKSTTITRNADAAADDLRPGDTITVQGATASNGDVSATSVSTTAPGVSSTAGGGFGGFAGAGTATTTTAG
jgi:hypothetical protein